MKIANPHHLQILNFLSSDGRSPDLTGFALKYVGTDKPSYHLTTVQTRKFVREFLKANQLSQEDFINLINSLYQGSTYDEIIIAALLIQGSPKFRPSLDPSLLDNWLSHIHGWAETDVLCQMAFDASDLLSNWSAWEKQLNKFNSDSNVHKRRASVVLLTKPVRQSPDPRLSKLAFQNLERLKSEKDILITKAVSCILRSLIKNHKDEVAAYLKANEDSLPRIAVREVTTKLATGKKYINQKKQARSS